MFEVTFLGTSAAVPSTVRGLPATLVDHGPRRFLVDCGEGTQRQLLLAGLGFRRIEHVLLTHAHADHILGLPGLAATLSQWEAAARLTLHAGPATLAVARTLLLDALWPFGAPGIDLSFREVAAGPIWSDDALRVDAIPLRHRAPDCFGYLFTEVGEARRLDRDRLTAAGVPDGPARSRLAAGEDVALADGRIVRFDDVAAPERQRLRIAVLGDTGPEPGLAEALRGVDLLVIEATFVDADRERARIGGHLTAKEAATIAVEAGAKGLWLTHISHRYDTEQIRSEARAIFPQAEVASDFDRLRITPAGVTRIA